MFKRLKDYLPLKRWTKTMTYSRLRQYLPMSEVPYVDDGDRINDAELVEIAWPVEIEKPRVGLVRDLEACPRWTKYRRFLETNSFPFGIYDIHAHDWIRKAQNFDVIAGLVSSRIYHLEEIREKFHFLETYLKKRCFPSTAHALLYENKSLEAYVAEAFDLPFAKTYICHREEDALALVESLPYPLVSKIDPSSGSVGVELLRNPKQARGVVKRAFSRNGRKVYVPYFRQIHYVCFQEFVPNDGYDIRVVLVGKRVFGYYRKVPRGDFRASGMNTWEKRALPEEAIRTAWKAHQCIQSPLLAVDMVHGLDGAYRIIEFSVVFQVESPEQLMVDGIPGAYVLEDDGAIRFEKGRYWVDELAIREFFLGDYLPKYAAGKRI